MKTELSDCLVRLGLEQPLAVMQGEQQEQGAGNASSIRSPIDGSVLAQMNMATSDQMSGVIRHSVDAFQKWRDVPAPRRGELVRQYGQLLREHKSELASVVSWEAGKITQEALGEVQEMIDVCDYAVGLSRQLYGLTISSERRLHRLMEQWHPLGPIGVISAFNFPVAVWAWNASIALVCGDPVVWKPSEKSPLSALACQSLLNQISRDFDDAPVALSSVVVGDATVGQTMASDARLPLISATGSVRMGRVVGQTVASRLGRSLLELGGNNAMIVAPSADIELAIRAIVFAAVGTCGQRCTTLRRLIVHESIADSLVDRLKRIYASLPIGNPLSEGVLVGPLIDADAAVAMENAIEQAISQGGRLVTGGQAVVQGVPSGGVYVEPAIVEIDAKAEILQEETFAPILYVLRYRELDEAIAIQNGVPQGLASAIFTNDLLEAERFCSPAGSDCGIANVNIGTSGAEIGGAFGGEKDTGGGRESGTDSWKAYMRRTTNTINYSTDLPLAQGIEFDVSE